MNHKRYGTFCQMAQNTPSNGLDLLVIGKNETYKLNRLAEFIALGWHAPYTISCVGVSAL